MTIGMLTPVSRFTRSLLTRASSALRCRSSSLTVASSSLADCASSLAVCSSSLVLCSSSLAERISSLADLSSSLVLSCSSMTDWRYSRRAAELLLELGRPAARPAAHGLGRGRAGEARLARRGVLEQDQEEPHAGRGDLERDDLDPDPPGRAALGDLELLRG